MSKRSPVTLSPAQMDRLAQEVGRSRSREVQAVVDILPKLDLLMKRIKDMSLDFSKLVAAVERQRTIDDGVIAMMNQLSIQMQDLSKQLKEKQDSGDADTAAIQAQIDRLANDADGEASRLAEALKANTPAVDAPSPAVLPPESGGV